MTTGPEEPREAGAGLGSAADEAAKLFASLQDWARETSEGMGWANQHIATGSEECTLCPVCRGISLVRSMSPEVYQHLAAAADSLADAFRAALASQERAASERRAGGVEHIDIG